MSKSGVGSIVTNKAISHAHLIEIDDGSNFIYLTDNDVFVLYGTHEYTPVQISFDAIKEDYSLSADGTNIAIGNINKTISAEILANEMRNRNVRIYRAVYAQAAQTISSTTYEFGLFSFDAGYPQLNLDGASYSTKSVILLFSGIIDRVTANETSASLNCTSDFIKWNKPYPSRTYSQTDFTTVIQSMTSEIRWGSY